MQLLLEISLSRLAAEHLALSSCKSLGGSCLRQMAAPRASSCGRPGQGVTRHITLLPSELCFLHTGRRRRWSANSTVVGHILRHRLEALQQHEDTLSPLQLRARLQRCLGALSLRSGRSTQLTAARACQRHTKYG